ncbi:MAG: hypothetical protein IJ769_00040 [Clostridia bacterium]|nr:hypothetical protein [Clostridia bacterium]
MKNRLKNLRERIFASEGYKKLPRPLRWIIGSLSNNLGYKLLSLLLAILLWNYVITTNTSITRVKTLYGLTGSVNGQSTLNSNQLALTEDPTGALSGLTVTVEAPQADYSKVSSGNVQVMLDLSSVRNTGTQEVPLRATSTYGRVRSISPQSLTLTFENLDSRNVTVNPVIEGEAEGYWYNVGRSNPSLLTVSGAASVVQSIASARVNVDVTGMNSSAVKVLPYTLLDADGNEISQTMLNRSTSSISVSLDIYPYRDIPFTTDVASLVTGQPAAGYVVDSVSIQPESIQVAADQELLDSLTELMIDPVSVNGASQSFSARATVSQLSDFKNVSSEQVYVNVNIVEEMITGYVENVKVLFSGTADNLVASYEPLGVFATGPRSAVEALQQSGMTVSVDLTGYEPGYYLLDSEIDTDRYPDLSFESEAVSVTLTDVSTVDAEIAE